MFVLDARETRDAVRKTLRPRKTKIQRRTAIKREELAINHVTVPSSHPFFSVYLVCI